MYAPSLCTVRLEFDKAFEVHFDPPSLGNGEGTPLSYPYDDSCE